MISLALLVCCLMPITTADVTDFQGMMFLYRYGYISEEDMANLRDVVDIDKSEMLEEAIMQYQDRSGLNITGVMDDETRKEMSLPRCGVQDINPLSKNDRVKRYAHLGTQWSKTDLTFGYLRSGSGNQGRQIFQPELDRAFRAWSAVTPLTFSNVNSRGALVDIDVLFASRDHGDSNRFDGPATANGAILAHAFQPNPGIGGDVHFDDEETWVVNSTQGIDFYTVAVHELGHALGLGHSTVRNAIMFASYTGLRTKDTLHQDDIQGIQSLYGGPQGQRPPPGGPTFSSGQADPSAPDICKVNRFDAGFQIPGTQDIFLFHNPYCYLLRQGLTGKVETGFPRRIRTVFRALEQVDAAFAWPDGQVFLFSGQRVWMYRGDDYLRSSTSQPISQRFPGIPNGLSGAVFWQGDQRTYFFQGGQYWRFDNTTINPVKRFFPLHISRWNGISGPTDAVLGYNGDVYFFQREVHYRYSNSAFRVLRGYPRRTLDVFFGCNSSPQTADLDDENIMNIIPPVDTGCSNGGDGGASFQKGNGGNSNQLGSAWIVAFLFASILR